MFVVICYGKLHFFSYVTKNASKIVYCYHIIRLLLYFYALSGTNDVETLGLRFLQNLVPVRIVKTAKIGIFFFEI